MVETHKDSLSYKLHITEQGKANLQNKWHPLIMQSENYAVQ